MVKFATTSLLGDRARLPIVHVAFQIYSTRLLGRTLLSFYRDGGELFHAEEVRFHPKS